MTTNDPGASALQPACERLARNAGPRPCAMDDGQLLACLLRRVKQPEEMAAGLIQRFGGLAAVLAADLAEVARAARAAPADLFDLTVCRELAVRLARCDASRRPAISSWNALETYARVAMAHRPREQFRVLFLNHRNYLLQDEMVAEGTVDHAPVYPREVVRRALEVSASAMVLVHNHPSGDPTPSQADIAMTRQVVEAARALGLQVHDHIIVGREGTASFRALGLI